MSTRSVALSGLSLVACVLYGALAWRTEAKPPSSRQTPDEELASNQNEGLRSELDQMRGELGRLTHQLRMQRAEQASPGADTEGDEAETPVEDDPRPPPDQRAQVIEAKVARRTALLDSTLAREAVDREWGDSVAVQASALIGPEGLKASELLQLECGSTMCKMRFKHRSLEEFENMPQALSKVNHRFAYVHGEPHEGNDEMYTTVYISREGHTLPK